MSDPCQVIWPSTELLALLVDTLAEYGGVARAAARDPYLRARWAALPESDRCEALLALAHVSRPPQGASWRREVRYARRLQRHTHRSGADLVPLRAGVRAPSSARAGLTAALVLVAAASSGPVAPSRVDPWAAGWLPQLLYLVVLGALIVALACGVPR